MAAAIVELDALADAVGAAAEDDDLLAVGRARLVLGRAGEGRLVGRVHVGGGRGELGGGGVDALIDRVDVERFAQGAHVLGQLAGEFGEPLVGKAHGLDAAQDLGLFGQAEVADLLFGVDDALDLLEEPHVDVAGVVDVLEAHAEPHGFGDVEQPVGRGDGDGGADGVAVLVLVEAEAGDADLVEAGEAGFERAQRLLQRFLEGAADGHGFADRLHRGGQAIVGAGEFLEGEARDLGDDVVDGGLERGRGGAAGDVVFELVEGVADGEAGGDLGDGEAGGLARPAPRSARRAGSSR